MKYEFLANAPASVKSKNPMDQMFTGWTKHSNPNIGVYAYGVRNAFGLTVSFSGKVMVSNNAANFGFGVAMLGLDPSSLQPTFDPSPTNNGVQTKDATWLDLKEVRGIANVQDRRSLDLLTQGICFLFKYTLTLQTKGEYQQACIEQRVCYGLVHWTGFEGAGITQNRLLHKRCVVPGLFIVR